MSKKQKQKQTSRYQEEVDEFTDRLYCLCREYCEVHLDEFAVTNKMLDTWGKKLWNELKQFEEVYARRETL